MYVDLQNPNPESVFVCLKENSDNLKETDIVKIAHNNGGQHGKLGILVGVSRRAMFKPKKKFNNSESPDNPADQLRLCLVWYR